MDNSNKTTTYDEHDTLFAGLRFVAGSDEYEDYYRNHPELKERDDELRDRG